MNVSCFLALRLVFISWLAAGPILLMAQEPAGPRIPAERSYADRTDSPERKAQQLEAAFRQKDFRLARALADSIRQTLDFEAQEQAPIGSPVLPEIGRAHV